NDNTNYSETLNNIADRSGNVMTEKVIQYKTGNRVDTHAPVKQSHTPSANAQNVPVNAVISVLFNEPLNPVSISSSGVRLYDTVLGSNVSVSSALSADGRQLSLTPLAPLA